jgi:gluconokinase
MNECVLAIDIGTSSARVIAYAPGGNSIPGLHSQTHYSLQSDQSGKAELDPEQLLNCVSSCIDDVLAILRLRNLTIAAVGCCTFWHSMLGVNSKGTAITPIFAWADIRASGAAEKLQGRVDAAAMHARTGCVIHPSYFPARLAWLAEVRQDVIRKVSNWMSPGEYLYSQWFDDSRCSVSMASGTGLFDQNRCDWDEEALNISGIGRDNLLPLATQNVVASGLRKEWSKRWPELKNIPWVHAIGDGAASNLGSGCANEQRIAINLGTSGAIRVFWAADHVDIPDDLWCYRLDRDRFVLGAAFSDGGDAFAWASRNMRVPDNSAIEKEIANRSPDCHGLTFLPFLAGERSMGWRPNARATLHGLSVTTTALDIVQAVMEGVALRFALAYDLLKERFPHADQVVASGGAIGASPAWARMIADAIGHPVTLSTETEASSRGAALLALKAAGLIADEANVAAPLGGIIQPDPNRNNVLRAALVRQQDLYQRLL